MYSNLLVATTLSMLGRTSLNDIYMFEWLNTDRYVTEKITQLTVLLP